MANSGGVVGTHIWNCVAPHIREELHPALERILARNLGDRERDGLVAYCLYYHPNVVATTNKKVLDKAIMDSCTGAIRMRNKNNLMNAAATGNPQPISRSPLLKESLAMVVCELGGETELLKLLGDRGPDYGLSLLIVLELLFQVAFCLRRQRETGTEALTAMSFSSRLLEIIALHLDAPPIWPRFTVKFGMALTGLIYHRKLQSLAATRLFQINYFVNPQLRKYLLTPGGGDGPGFMDEDGITNITRNSNNTNVPPNSIAGPPALSTTYTHSLLDWRVEETLWTLVKNLSLEQPTREVMEKVRRGERPSNIQCRIDAMAIVFERLHHLSDKLFGTELYLYGSGATGFATVNSDIDVVVHITEEQEEKLINEARQARCNALDLNLFPALQNFGGGAPMQTGAVIGASGIYPLIGDWSWLDEKNSKTAAAIWLNRKFAWACYRLYGWSVQCVQSAYVPIVRILAAVDTETAMPCELPTVFMPDYPYGSTLVSLLRQIDLETRNFEGVRHADKLDNMLLLLALSRGMTIARVKRYIARTVAYEIISEVMYATGWAPSLSSLANYKDATFYLNRLNLRQSPGHAPLEPRICKIEDNLLTLFYVYWNNLRHRLHNGSFLLVNPRGSSPALHPPKPDARIDDGRLSTIKSQRDIYIVEADVSVGRQVGIHNSRLLRAYARVDPRVIALGLLVKQWARTCSIEDAYNGYLSGYQWTLIVIHFLQHYCCLPVPAKVESTSEWRKLLATFRYAQCGFAPKHLPILPNLQNPLTDCKMPNFTKEGPLIINEIEGNLDVWFYEPHLGNNESVEGGTTWPENTLLKSHPLLYAYTLLQSPYNLQEIAGKLSDQSFISLNNRSQNQSANQIMTNLAQSFHSKDTTAEENAVWLMRLQSCPRPHTDRPWDGDSTPVNNSASKTLTPHMLWDVQRSKLHEKMLRTLDDSRRETCRSSFPPLAPLRDTTFIQQHVMDRSDTLIETFRTIKGEPTLAELLFGFFEYFGTRLNYATDVSVPLQDRNSLQMIDTARTPDLPRGKKEWFQTAIFDPDYEDASLTGHREVAGRGNGPFQYRGRHFLCLRDPMEKLRTVGPPYRCQTMITKSLSGSITALSDINRMTDRTAVKTSLEEMFTKQPGVTPSVLRVARTPVKECLKEYIDAPLKCFSSAMTASETHECRSMYVGLRKMITENGNYRSLNGPAEGGAMTDRPLSFAHQPQIGTRGVIAGGHPSNRRHSVTNLSSPSHLPKPQQFGGRGGSLPKTTAVPENANTKNTDTRNNSTGNNHNRPVSITMSNETRETNNPSPRLPRNDLVLAPPVRGRCTSLPGTAPLPSAGGSSGGEASILTSDASSSVEVSDSGTDDKVHNQSVVENFKDSELSWCMKPVSFRRFQAYLRQPAVIQDNIWRVKDYDDPIKWLEQTTGIKRTSKFRYPTNGHAPPPIRSIRSRQANPPTPLGDR